MCQAKYERLWNLLNEHQFKFNVPLNNELMCTICQRFLRNPYQSPCGCRYCLVCIRDYLDGTEKFCPGEMDECGEQTIELGRNLQIDYAITKKIFTINVNCPEELCDFTDELKNFEEHMLSHNRKCPYHPVGCKETIGNTKTLDKHVNEAVYEHTELLMETMTSLTRQMGCIKNSLEVVKGDSLKKDERLREMEKRLEEIGIHQCNEINELKDKLAKRENLSWNSVPNTTKSHNKIPQTNDNHEQMDIKLDDLCQERDSQSDSWVSADSELSCSGAQSIPRGATSHYSPFTWKITDFKSQRCKAKSDIQFCLTSDEFYSGPRGYKMYLTVYPNGAGPGRSTHLSVFFHVMKGEFDDELSWPMKRGVTIGLVGQGGGSQHFSRTYSYYTIERRDRHKLTKPTVQKNGGCGNPQFVTFSELFNNGKVYHDDSITLRCLIINNKTFNYYFVGK